MLHMPSATEATLQVVQDDSEIRKLNAIVGAALKALADSGAEDEFVGAFAAAHRVKVASILGVGKPATETPDLLTIVTQAVGVALTQAGVGKSKTLVQNTKRVNVEIAGRRTSLTLSRTVLERLTETKETKQQVKAVIQDLANTAPATVTNRSGWVEERLLTILSHSVADTSTSARH